ncbi:MAG: hypothetical protein B6A08_18790 [Sorangiineae bacterium NIC37A_2]|nr:MAG: hypothetical protein B6A08_18790 [Sorangiineae bacterium NIC37A_2]
MSFDLPSRARPKSPRRSGIPLTALVITLVGALAQTACPGGAELEDAESFLDSTPVPASGGSSSGGSPGTGGGSPGTGGGGPGAGGSMAADCDIPALLNVKCGTAICHGTATDATAQVPGNVNLIAPGVESRVVGVDASYDGASGDCPSTPEKLIDPSDLQKSLLWTKVNGGHACGDKMPSVGTLTPDQVDCYNDWLETLGTGSP